MTVAQIQKQSVCPVCGKSPPLKAVVKDGDTVVLTAECHGYATTVHLKKQHVTGPLPPESAN